MFGVLIFVHELGHFLAAKATGVGVSEFSVGMGPKIVYRQGKSTLYSLRTFPIGGFVRLESLEENPDSIHAYENKSAPIRIIVMFAGAFMNVLFALVLSVLLTASDPYIITNTVADFHETNYSSQSGLQTGDSILEIDGKKVHTSSDIVFLLTYSGGQPLDVTVERDGAELVLKDVSFEKFEQDGITGYNADFYLTTEAKTVSGVLREGFFQCFAVVRSIWTSFAMLAGGKIGVSALSGPVGTTAVMSQAVSYGFSTVLYIIMMLSVNLGIVNLIPFPMLDGGKIVIAIGECITGKKLNPKIEAAINSIGVILLIVLMLFVTFNDILRL